MASAICENGDCDRGEWSLQKPPGDYAGGVNCPDCGTSRVDVQTDQQGQRPARRGQQTGQQPATQQQPAGTVGEAAAMFDPEVNNVRRAQAAGSVFGQLGNVVAQLFQYQETKQQAQKQRAENVELEQTNLPKCNAQIEEDTVCGYQFSPEDIGVSADRVRCPECNAVYNINEQV